MTLQRLQLSVVVVVGLDRPCFPLARTLVDSWFHAKENACHVVLLDLKVSVVLLVSRPKDLYNLSPCIQVLFHPHA